MGIAIVVVAFIVLVIPLGILGGIALTLRATSTRSMEGSVNKELARYAARAARSNAPAEKGQES